MAADLTGGSLHEALVRAGFVPPRHRHDRRGGRRRPEEARLLQIRTGDPLLVERRVIVDRTTAGSRRPSRVYAADRYALDVQFDVEARDVGRTPGDA